MKAHTLADKLRRSAPFVRAIIEAFIFSGSATPGNRASTLIEKDQVRKADKP
jgi:hypothetical protein